jgi:hypothetical protein
MSWLPVGANQWERSVPTQTQDELITARLRTASFALRSIFLVSLIVVVARVSWPQSTDIWNIYNEPGDMIRLALGLAFCIWIAFQVFSHPKDAHAHRTWVYLGLAAVPFALICMIWVW